MFRATAPLVLASGSPRRRDFLADLGLAFVVQKAEIDEAARPGEEPSAFVARLAREKAEYVAGRHPAPWILAADTVVVVEQRILGKPGDGDEALEMLRLLSGRWHEVWTGFRIMQGQSGLGASREVCTRVRFMDLSPALCAAYLRTGEPFDKAGGYGIQGKGAFLVAEIKGSYTNVVGLPIAELLAELLRLRIIAPAGKPAV